MHPINKQFITPEELRADARTLFRKAHELKLKGHSAFSISDLVARAFSKNRLARAEQAEIDARDLAESALHLEAMRAPRAIATPSNPYGELPSTYRSSLTPGALQA